MYFSLHIVDNLDFVSYRLNTQAVMVSEVGKDPGFNSRDSLIILFYLKLQSMLERGLNLDLKPKIDAT